MTLKQMVNDVISTTGIGHTISTVAGLDPDSDEAKVVSFIRKAQLDVSRKVPNASLKFTGSITTLARVQLSSTTVTNASSSVTLNAAGDPAYAGRLAHVQGDSGVYRVLKVVSTTLTLADLAGNEVAYSGTTSTTATLEIAQDRYQLPANFKLPHNFNQFWGPGLMTYYSPERFDDLRFEQGTTVWEVGNPDYFTIFSVEMASGEPRHLVQFWPIPKEAKSYPFRYEGSPSLMEADSDVSGYHPEYEQAILTRARYYVYRFIARDDVQWQAELGDWRDIFGDQMKNPVVAGESPQLQPQTSKEFWENAY